MTWGHRYKKNPRYKNCRYLCPYCALRVSKSLDLWCVFDRLSNFKKWNLRSGHLTWPRCVTFGVIGSSFFFRIVSNCWLNSYGKFGGATRRHFFAICEKSEGADTCPHDRVRGLIKKKRTICKMAMADKYVHTFSSRYLQKWLNYDIKYVFLNRFLQF